LWGTNVDLPTSFAYFSRMLEGLHCVGFDSLKTKYKREPLGNKIKLCVASEEIL